MEKVIKYDFELVSHWGDLVYACETRPIKLSVRDWCRQHSVDYTEYVEWKQALSLYAYHGNVSLEYNGSQSLERKVRLVKECKQGGILPNTRKQMTVIVEQDKATAIVEKWVGILERGERREKGKSMAKWCNENNVLEQHYYIYRELMFLLSPGPQYRELCIKWKNYINQANQTKLTITEFLSHMNIPVNKYYAAKRILAARLDPDRVTVLLRLIEGNMLHGRHSHRIAESTHNKELSQEQIAAYRMRERVLSRRKNPSITIEAEKVKPSIPCNIDPYAEIETKGVKITLASNVEKEDVQYAIDILQALQI